MTPPRPTPTREPSIKGSDPQNPNNPNSPTPQQKKRRRQHTRKVSSRMQIVQKFKVMPRDQRRAIRFRTGDKTSCIYEVTKINKRGRRQKRMLRLMVNGIENIRPQTNVISSAATWDKINLVFLKDNNKICVKFRGHGDRVYETDEAPRLVEHIREYMAAYNQAIDNRNREDISIMLHKRILLQEVRYAADKESDEATKKRVASGRKVKRKIEEILLPEAKEKEKAPVKKAKHPVKLSVDETLRNPPLSRYCQTFFKNWKRSFKREKDCLDIARNLMDQLKDHVMERKWKNLVAVAFKGVEPDKLTEDQRMAIEKEVENSIEQYIVPTLLDDVTAFLKKTHSETTVKLTRNVQKLKEKTLGYFNCSEEVIKSSKLHNWDPAKHVLSKMSRVSLPSEKVQVIFDTVQMIYTLANSGGAEGSAKNVYLSGDDLLPICIFVIIQASIKRETIVFDFSDWAYIDQLVGRDTLSGEYEYYLTVFEACLCHILEYT